MSVKPYRQLLEESGCDCVGGLVEMQYGKWYESYLTECQKCNSQGGVDDKESSKIHNLGD